MQCTKTTCPRISRHRKSGMVLSSPQHDPGTIKPNTTMQEPADEKSDRDETNPVELTADEWSEVYANMDDYEGFIAHDHSMDY